MKAHKLEIIWEFSYLEDYLSAIWDLVQYLGTHLIYDLCSHLQIWEMYHTIVLFTF
jgi:hypothetical protein